VDDHRQLGKKTLVKTRLRDRLSANRENMPWQSAPPLIIIGGAFAATGLLLNGVDRLAYGRVRF